MWFMYGLLPSGRADCSQLAGIAVYGNVGTQINTSYFGTALLELLFDGTADKVDGALVIKSIADIWFY